MLDEHISHDNFGIMPYINVYDLKIPTYSIFMVLALIAAFICYKLTAEKIDRGKNSFRSLIIIYALLGGAIGAKLPILIYNYKILFSYPENINLLISGKTIVGGLIGGFLAVFLVKRRFKIELKTGNDIAAPAAFGMAIGRLGCFFGGCCYGIESPQFLGVDFGDGIYRYPTQIYELIFDLGLFVLFLYLKRTKELRPGVLFKYLLNAYFIFRFLIEFVRDTETILGISYYQILCSLCLIFINRKHILAVFNKKQVNA
ncbi:MAG: hypothetical protein A2Y15_03175 [Clostridiales bacterium GWF2_36_10]|nr:MAG: hypothetical protein A2Y15_03175 [Clostridiales bacterium GWF2_36_10]HAN20974.1 diacylglyceryl transferase [Clostridiales bacterium]